MTQVDVEIKVYGEVQVSDIPNFIPEDKSLDDVKDSYTLDKGTHYVKIGGKTVKFVVLDH